MALADAEKKLKNVMKKLDSVSSNFITEKESWEKNMASVEENWRCKMLILFTSEICPFFWWEMVTKIMNVDGAVKCESLKAQSNGHVDDELQKNLGEMTLKYEKLKVSS